MENKRHIVFVINSMSSAGGSERVTANLSNLFSSWPNYRVTIIALRGESSFYTLNEKVVLKCLNGKSLLQVFRRLISTINSINPTYVLGISINKLNVSLGIASLFFKQRRRFNMYACEHISYVNSSSLLQKIKNVVYKSFDKIIVLTSADKTIFNNLGFQSVEVIPNFSSYAPVDMPYILDRSKTILTIGALSKRKGFDRIINIWKVLYDTYKDWDLLIIGEGEEYANLANQIVSLNISARTKILPNTKNVQDYYNDAQIFSMTSHSEGLPMVLIEANSFGLPLIGYDCETGPRDIIDTKVGFLIENNNEQEFINKMKCLLGSDEIRENLYTNSLVSKDRFSQKNIASLWSKILS